MICDDCGADGARWHGDPNVATKRCDRCAVEVNEDGPGPDECDMCGGEITGAICPASGDERPCGKVDSDRAAANASVRPHGGNNESDLGTSERRGKVSK